MKDQFIKYLKDLIFSIKFRINLYLPRLLEILQKLVTIIAKRNVYLAQIFKKIIENFFE